MISLLIALAAAERITGPDVQVRLIKDGDHRLSREEDLALLGDTLESLVQPSEARIAGDDVEVLLIKDGDHRLSRSRDLAHLTTVLDDLIADVRRTML